MPDAFRWNEWNLDHATKHGCRVEDIEAVVIAEHPGRKIGNGKIKVVGRGRGRGGQPMQVVYVIDPEEPRQFYVIHAMPVTTRRRRG